MVFGVLAIAESRLHNLGIRTLRLLPEIQVFNYFPDIAQ